MALAALALAGCEPTVPVASDFIPEYKGVETALLEGPALEDARARRAAWLAAPVRPAAHADAAYPADQVEAARFFDEHLAHASESTAQPVRRLDGLPIRLPELSQKVVRRHGRSQFGCPHIMFTKTLPTRIRPVIKIFLLALSLPLHSHHHGRLAR